MERQIILFSGSGENLILHSKEVLEMLRKPIGQYSVSICRIDAEPSEACGRRLSLMFFYPSYGGSVPHPYMDGTYQRQAAGGQPEDNGVETFCFADGHLSSAKERFPVVIYSHGLMGYQMDSTVLCADIASSGYVVVSVGHPYGAGAVTYCDGETAFGEKKRYNERMLDGLGKLWVEDIVRAIDCVYAADSGETESLFADRLDIAEGVHLLGTSFGGCCSIAAALREERAVDAVNMDGGIFVELDPVFADRPLLVFRSSINCKASRRLTGAGCTDVTVEKFRGIAHWEFADGVYLSEKGKSNRDWADRVSRARAQRCLDFFQRKYS